MFFCFITILCFIKYSSTLYEECHVRDLRGTCQLLENCPGVINLIQHNGRPEICDLEGTNLIVCCLNLKQKHGPRSNPRSQPGFNRRPGPGPRRKVINNFVPKFNQIKSNIQGNPEIEVIVLEDPNQLNYFPSDPGPIITLNSGLLERFPQNYKPSTLRTEEFRTTTNVSPSINQLETGTSISIQKCLKYYPEPLFPSFIAGGKKSLPKQFPHMALVGFGYNENEKHWLCGGSLISDRFVLTAAHCIYSNEYGRAKWIHLGDLDLSTNKDDASPEDFNIIKIIPHPDYKRPQKYHDIALLELDKKAEFSAYIAPACLQTTKNINETSMIATGWGRTGFAEDSSSFLMQVNLNEVDVEQCRKSFGVDENYLPFGVLDNIQICAGDNKGKDTCNGDSGGPLQVKNPFRSSAVQVHTVVGITSFGKPCGLTSSPGVYTRVSYYTKWIESIVWANDQH